MRKQNNYSKGLQGRPADIARLDFHDWNGEILDRIRAKVTEKKIGVLMIDKIKDNFGITDIDIRYYHNEEMKEERKRIFDTKPINWKRDEQGRII